MRHVRPALSALHCESNIITRAGACEAAVAQAHPFFADDMFFKLGTDVVNLNALQTTLAKTATIYLSAEMGTKISLFYQHHVRVNTPQMLHSIMNSSKHVMQALHEWNREEVVDY
eukprot:gb/GEZJ01002609.1/.p5 GENE.gb/GEZJ01002609.1/~~gb/GEZJ01002609.1/.p5  ORF type:complete len:115 (+),score=17.65 gb/GEZJ01002609.1/:1252-1596(+)